MLMINNQIVAPAFSLMLKLKVQLYVERATLSLHRVNIKYINNVFSSQRPHSCLDKEHQATYRPLLDIEMVSVQTFLCYSRSLTHGTQ